MKIDAAVTVRRDDGTTLSREVRVETQSVYERGAFRRETKAETTKRFQRMLDAAARGVGLR